MSKRFSVTLAAGVDLELGGLGLAGLGGLGGGWNGLGIGGVPSPAWFCRDMSANLVVSSGVMLE
jgi:hypothetical protein